jgi:hypothetical protein
MTFLENKWVLVSLVTLCWAISTSFIAGYYIFQYSDLSAKVKGVIISADLGVNYGNGSAVVWFNGTKISAGATLLDLTKLVASVNYTGMMDAINGVSNSPKWWMWWSWSSFGWSFGYVACDKYVVGENEILLWYYQDVSSYPPSPP